MPWIASAAHAQATPRPAPRRTATWTVRACFTDALVGLVAGALLLPHLAGALTYPVIVDPAPAGATLTQYPVRIMLRAPAFDFSRSQPGGSDVRVTDAGGQPIPFWIESWDPARGCADVWARVPAIAPDSATILDLVCGSSDGTPSSASATFPFYDGFEQAGRNAAQPLDTPTYDGSGQATHPDVIFVPGGWNGWNYWMVLTPYPYNVESLENPSILVSADGQNWQVPAGLTNPIVPPVAGYNNDPDMVLVGDTLMVYYNETLYAGTTDIRRVTSTNGVAWSAPITVLHLPNYEMSPAIVVDEQGWHMLYATSPQGCTADDQTVVVRSSTDGLIWSDAVIATFSDSSVVPWHFNAVKQDGRYVMLLACYPHGSTCDHTDLYYAVSTDYQHWSLTPQPVLRHSQGSWDDLEIYRSALLLDGDELRIWYGAQSVQGAWHIGYAEGGLADFLSPATSGWDETDGQVVTTDELARTGAHSLRLDGGATFPEIAGPFQRNSAVTAWMYDDLDATPDRLGVLRAWDAGNADFPLHAIGVGYYEGASDTRYAYHSEGWDYFDTGVSRSTGWHRLSIAAGDSACRLSIDDHVVATLDVLDPASIDQFSLAGYLAGSTYFDDVYTRPYVDHEPRAHLGSPGDTVLDVPSGRFGSGAPQLAPLRPNPVVGRATIAFSLPRAAWVDVDLIGVNGRRVRRLASANLPAGEHQIAWDGLDAAGRPAPAGVYLVSLRSNGERRTRRLVVLR